MGCFTLSIVNWRCLCMMSGQLLYCFHLENYLKSCFLWAKVLIPSSFISSSVNSKTSAKATPSLRKRVNRSERSCRSRNCCSSAIWLSETSSFDAIWVQALQGKISQFSSANLTLIPILLPGWLACLSACLHHKIVVFAQTAFIHFKGQSTSKFVNHFGSQRPKKKEPNKSRHS